ncbi:D-glycero-beta-D-manno-heptose-1,7-bisphosphate 7-phosphatase [Candidatus Providencia siddallii]|uniref:D,D-heptose 1,7-bisphosphate phosphatase n=1 Tax=Candidatus Providencia siddallii TaxID=1715285 RepID=A0A0M6W915_9GAMM|nr:D-glycero-beta-D-manno-heptose-1,7-bisphosphate 7-phosphatase [Candidatus Providencia siddallii]
MNKITPAIFLDRDGTINIDYGHVYKINDFQFIEGSIEAMLKFKTMGYAIVVVTNQSGIGLGIYTEKQFLQLSKWMNQFLADCGINLDGIFFCPHHPDAKYKKYRQKCKCRKPEPGLLLDAQLFLNIDAASSIMIGDKYTDILAGKAANIKTNVLVTSNNLKTNESMTNADIIINSIANLPEKLFK